ncbi:hypothetical protein [Haliangium sp.]|uniref:hypothetical protein n=1 Tax=Haliangium sp. TaxID=2663208 RepID=UPI003D0DA20E
MAFVWTTPTSTVAAPDRRVAMYRRELTERAALFYRLGYTAEQATARLQANVAWDFGSGADPRPPALADTAVAELVQRTYARRPAG